MSLFAKTLNYNMALTSAIAAIDCEAKKRGHRVLVQELIASASGWEICLWAKGNEEYDPFYESLFSKAVNGFQGFTATL